MSANTQDIAIFGGTFDPIHLGHIQPALQIADWLSLKKIILLPAHIPPHKQAPHASNSHRIAMLEAVKEQHPLFEIDKRELYKDSPSFTVETLTQYRQEFPNARLYFLIGMDSLMSFTRWHQWQRILALCHLVVSTRPGLSLAQADHKTTELLNVHGVSNLAQVKQQLAGHIIIAPEINCDVSSTKIRAKIAGGEDIAALVPKRVANYINHHQLYKN